MKPLDQLSYHPTSERLTEILCNRTQSTDPLFFRVLIAYYFSVLASMMRCQIKTMDRDKVPVNMYAINLATSGFGKGRSLNIIEGEVINQFLHRFKEETFPFAALKNLPVIANERALRNQSDPDEELEKANTEFKNLGPIELSFSSATESAIKQFRHKLLMANAGALTLQIDEIGSNLTGETEALNAFLELFDMGKIKNSLRKNTSDNKRLEAIEGMTPTNMLLFGTPSKLFNGSKTEEEFYSMLDTGYARRCFYGYTRGNQKRRDLTAREVLHQRVDTAAQDFIQRLSDQLGALAAPMHMNSVLPISEAVTLLFIEYQLECERLAEELPEHEEIRKAELCHRYFKAMKLAGAYAFVDCAPEITEDYAYYAIKLAEESGKAFEQLLTRDRPYVKLAKYIANVGRSVTQADLVEDLPFYKGSASQKQDMMQLAIAHGYQNNIIIKKSFNEGIEFLRGETLKPTDLEKLYVSYSQDLAKDYKNDFAPFDKLHVLTQNTGLHWVNHHLKDGHRSEDTSLPGFNLLVVDVDGTVSMPVAQKLLKDFKALFYTTKRHTAQHNRFRIIMPMNYELKLDAKDYKEFMQNVFEWLPFEVDTSTGQRSRKWLSHNGSYAYQDGDLIDILSFIPKTSKNENWRKLINDQQQMDALERWFIYNTGDGNRNNQLLRYAMILVDAGFDYEGVRLKVNSLNEKLPDKLLESEILGTILVTVSKSIAKRDMDA
jgi:hypothetical protein